MPADSLPESETLLRIPLELMGPAVRHGNLQPVCFGVPLPKGRLMQPGSAVLAGTQQCVPAQTQATNYWPDGSIRWLLVDALLSENVGMDSCWLELTPPGRHSCPHSIDLQQSSARIEIKTGVARFVIDRGQLRPFERAQTGKQNLCSSRIKLADHKKRVHQPECDAWRIETDGPLRTTLVGEGRFVTPRELRVILRLNFYAGTGLVKLEVTLHNPKKAKHEGGLWDLGDRGSVFFEDLSVEFDCLHQHDRLSWSLTPEQNETSSSDSLKNWSVYQDSSGGENWNSVNHVNHEGEVPSRFQGYQLKIGDDESTGWRALPTVTICRAGERISLAVPEFWQHFPTAISIQDETVRVGLFPGEQNGLFELQGGEQKTHTIWLEFASCDSCHAETNNSLHWVHRPLALRPLPGWCDSVRTLPQFCGLEPQTTQKLDTLLDESLQLLLENRERVDEYGWRNFGDVFADHEQTYYKGTKPLVSHYNNQFDMVYGFLLQFLRTGDRRWFDLGDGLARHVIDIDIYHTTEDRAAYNGGLFWFTDHYLHAETSTHRTYSRANAPPKKGTGSFLRNGSLGAWCKTQLSPFSSVYGGGPGAQHNFTSGLLLYHHFTGDPKARNAVTGLANWVINMDDGRQHVLGVLDDGPTGLASGRDHRAPDRAGGNSINALLDAWILTADPTYLGFVERLIQRCVHPADDVDSRNLLDIENRWSYTVFFSSIAKYLQVKQECNQIDESYAYGQACLLHYATWMLDHEVPYFDQREKMEYPTEAWAAQELRKANVLRWAALHADNVTRQRLLDRGDKLADRAWSDLNGFATRTHTRAMAVVMVEGLLDCWFRSRPPQRAIRPELCGGFGLPQRFVPQKQRIRDSLNSPRDWPLLAMRATNPWRWVRYAQTQKKHSR